MKIIVVANPKGGTGKSTIAMHLLVGLSKQKYKVLGIDLDNPQYSLYSYSENRKRYIEQNTEQSTKETQNIEEVSCISINDIDTLNETISNNQNMDIIIIDTPGNMNELFAYAHNLMNVLVTPLNDSLFDIDVLVKASVNKNGESAQSTGTKLGVYGNFIWEKKKERALGGSSFKWIVLRNRLNALFTKNKERIQSILSGLSKKIGFEISSGIMDRVVYKQAFDKGITVLDLETSKLTSSQLSARQEIRTLIHDILQQLQH